MLIYKEHLKTNQNLVYTNNPQENTALVGVRAEPLPGPASGTAGDHSTALGSRWVPGNAGLCVC